MNELSCDFYRGESALTSCKRMSKEAIKVGTCWSIGCGCAEDSASKCEEPSCLEAWCEKCQHHHKPLSSPQAPQTPRELLFKEVTERAWAIQESRKQSYGEEWQNRSSDSHLHGAIYKAERAFYNRTDKEKRKDDILDAINMLVFAMKEVPCE